jgi:ferredoxin
MSDTVPSTHVVSINHDRCQGHSRCCSIAPQLFDSDDLGFGVVRGDGLVPEDLLDKARLVVANCPEFAVTLKRITSDE